MHGFIDWISSHRQTFRGRMKLRVSLCRHSNVSFSKVFLCTYMVLRLVHGKTGVGNWSKTWCKKECYLSCEFSIAQQIKMPLCATPHHVTHQELSKSYSHCERPRFGTLFALHPCQICKEMLLKTSLLPKIRKIRNYKPIVRKLIVHKN